MGSTTYPAAVVTGAGGQVGRAVAQWLPEARLLTRAQLDVRDPRAVGRAVAGADVVLHAAAFTDVDGCEKDPEHAFAVNAEGTHNIEDAASRTGARVVYLSTDYVFDGLKRSAYEEDDDPNPINEYGRSKLEGERRVRSRRENLVVRTSWIIGDGRNFVRAMVAKAEAGSVLRVVDDQRGRPTFADSLAQAVVELVRREASGIMHVAGDGDPCTWANLARLALQRRGLSATLEPVSTDEYAASVGYPVAPRPKNSVLSLEKARQASVPLVDWRRSLDSYLERL